MEKCGIYRITNLVNGRCYYGSSICLSRRLNEHLYNLRNNKHENQFLQNDFIKCGETAFVLEVIEFVESEERLLSIEQQYLDEYWDNKNTCYNINPVAAKPPSWLGKTLSDEHKMNLSRANSGKKMTLEQRAKLSAVQKGKRLSDETKQKLSAANKRLGKRPPTYKGEQHPNFGKTPSEENRKKMSESAKKRKPRK